MHAPHVSRPTATYIAVKSAFPLQSLSTRIVSPFVNDVSERDAQHLAYPLDIHDMAPPAYFMTKDVALRADKGTGSPLLVLVVLM